MKFAFTNVIIWIVHRFILFKKLKFPTEMFSHKLVKPWMLSGNLNYKFDEVFFLYLLVDRCPPFHPLWGHDEDGGLAAPWQLAFQQNISPGKEVGTLMNWQFYNWQLSRKKEQIFSVSQRRLNGLWKCIIGTKCTKDKLTSWQIEFHFEVQYMVHKENWEVFFYCRRLWLTESFIHASCFLIVNMCCEKVIPDSHWNPLNMCWRVEIFWASKRFLVESLIRVMYWVAATILNWPFKPLNTKFCIIFLHISVH